MERAMRTLVIEEGFRSDGRALDQLRPLTCEVDVLPRVHGAALFTRGETQSLGVTTLGMVGEDDQILDGLKIDEPAKRFMLHYNFPPFSVGEVRPMRGPGRREIGHGALAERALRCLMPTAEEFPYAVRVVSDILESNGSSSMASVCSGSLSLMAAGVPVRKSCAGVAMGLIKEGEKVAILTDIQGLEDHYGDMDFKVAGTRDGITALQMDNKAGGITRAILEQALSQARRGRMEILDAMDATIDAPRKELSAFAPRITTIQINPEKIRDIIGPGGKVIRNIVATTGAKVDVEDSGRVLVASADEGAVSRALAMIHELVREVQVGEIFVGKVVRMVAFGAFVELLPGRDGLLHVSEIGQKRIEKPEDVFALGDPVLVLVKEIDDMGRVNVSRKKALADAEKLRQSAEYDDILALESDRDRLIDTLPAAAPRRPEGAGPERSGDRDRHGSRGGAGHGGGAGRPPRRP
ncbi:MAG: Polyribonucleotide nucleotidyltransferase [Synergistetes bacterium ADurb.Bin520]|nr:MAG: Polyribonucleotide nucleotidyltransferase [Synergistetes bacterium ADurb.Bin520]